jgi:hypothetical protein
VGLGTKSQVLRVVEKDSEFLSDLVHDFTRAAVASNIHIFCFFEQHASDTTKILGLKRAKFISYKVRQCRPNKDGCVR